MEDDISEFYLCFLEVHGLCLKGYLPIGIRSYDNHALSEHSSAVVGLETLQGSRIAIVDTGDAAAGNVEENLVVGIRTEVTVLVDYLDIHENEMLCGR